MQKAIEYVNPEYIINKRGNKKAVVLGLKAYENILEVIINEDFRDR